MKRKALSKREQLTRLVRSRKTGVTFAEAAQAADCSRSYASRILREVCGNSGFKNRKCRVTKSHNARAFCV